VTGRALISRQFDLPVGRSDPDAPRSAAADGAGVIDAEFSPVAPALPVPVEAPSAPSVAVKARRSRKAAAGALRAALADADRAYRQVVEDTPACGRRVDIEI